MKIPSKHFSKLVRDESGTTAIMFGITAIALIAGVGAAVSYSYVESTKAHHQEALDAAVIAGVILPDNAQARERIRAATAIYNANIGRVVERSGQGSLTQFDVPIAAPNFTVNGTTVSGTADIKVKNPFPIVGGDLISVTITATAKKAATVPLCILGLNASEAGSFNQNGHSRLNATNCAAQFNSANASGMLQQGNPTASARAFGVSGGVNGASFSPPPITGTSKIDDPYASMAFPSLEACIDASSKFRSTEVTLDPGTYCGGIDVKAGTSLTLNPGIYIMKDGNFTVQSGSTVIGREVLLAFIGVSGNWPSTLMLLGGATMNVTSPSNGYYAGIQFFAAREKYTKMGWPSIGGAGNAAANLTYDGLMYFPTQDVWIYGGSTVIAKSPTLAVVTEQLWLQDNATLAISRENSRSIQNAYTTPGLSYGAVLVK